MKDTVQQAIEAQIGNEFDAAYSYLSMAAYFDAEDLNGFATWMYEQSREEVAHAMKLFGFLTDRGVAPHLPALSQPPCDFSGPVDAFSRALEHEQKVTSQISALYELTMTEKDHAAHVLLQWFVSEQLEEEKQTSGILHRLRMVEGSSSALLILDAELGARGNGALVGATV